MPAWCRRAGSNCLIGAYETPALPLSYTDIWQARQGSNLRMRDSKSRAFPLGDAPIFAFSANKSGAACGYRSRFPGLKDQDASQYTNAANLERARRIELRMAAWKAAALPLSYARDWRNGVGTIHIPLRGPSV